MWKERFGLHAQAFRSEGNIGSPTDRASNGIDPRADPECIDVCAKDPSSGQLCGVKALFPILAFIARELAGRPYSTINLCTPNLALGIGINRRALPAMRRAVAEPKLLVGVQLRKLAKIAIHRPSVRGWHPQSQS